MKRFIIMGLVTLVLVLIIIFYDPNKNYLGVFKDNITIDSIKVTDCTWEYEINGASLVLDSEETVNNTISSKYKIFKEGSSSIIYRCTNADETKYTITYSFNVKDNKIIWTEAESLGLLDFSNPY